MKKLLFLVMAKTLINVGVMFLTLLLGVASARGQSLLDLDPVSTSRLSGGNPGAWRLSDFWQMVNTSSSMHSCYGTGAPGCVQVQNPVRGGPQGTPEGNAKLIEYRGGELSASPSNKGGQP